MPTPIPTEARELVLPHNDPGKPVGVHSRLPLTLRHLIELPKCLPEGLPHSFIENSLAPLLQFAGRGRKRMPQTNLGRRGWVEHFSTRIVHLVFAAKPGSFPSMLFAKNPNQPPSYQPQ